MNEDYNNPEYTAFWEELKDNVVLDVDCSSWDHSTAIQCFGAGYEAKKITGHITKVRIGRGKKKSPTFDISFPDKRGPKEFKGFDINYIWKYAREVPPKYQTMRAAYLVELARQAGMMAQPDRDEETESDGYRSDDQSEILVSNKEGRQSKEHAQKRAPKKVKPSKSDYEEML
jgi:hypothetical protein